MTYIPHPCDGITNDPVVLKAAEVILRDMDHLGVIGLASEGLEAGQANAAVALVGLSMAIFACREIGMDVLTFLETVGSKLMDAEMDIDPDYAA